MATTPPPAASSGLPRNVRWVLYVCADPAVTARAKALAAVCGLRYMDWRTLGDCRPGPTRLANELGCDYRTAQRALRDLCAHGYMVKVHVGGIRRGQRVATTYRGVFPKRSTPAKAP